MPVEEEHARDRIVDRIIELIGAYAERLDAGDLDEVAALFDQGTFRSTRGGEPLVGRDAVRRQYDPVLLYDDATPRTKHVLANIEVVVGDVIDGEAITATSRCTFAVFQQANGSDLRAILAGRYHDRFECDDDGWHFVERVVHPDLIGDLSLHMSRR